MKDLEVAKRRLKMKTLTLSIVRDGRPVFETDSHGIVGFLDAIEKCGEKLRGSSVADRVVGKAVALLCVYSRVKEVFALVLSERARETLELNSVGCEWESLVGNIMGVDMKKECMFEKCVLDISDPKIAYERIKRF
jgi:hypothetical protein